MSTTTSLIPDFATRQTLTSANLNALVDAINSGGAGNSAAFTQLLADDTSIESQLAQVLSAIAALQTQVTALQAGGTGGGTTTGGGGTTSPVSGGVAFNGAQLAFNGVRVTFTGSAA